MMHKAIIAEITKVQEIPGADFIQTAFVLGEQVVVSKSWGAGMLGVFFQTDLKLSVDFCYHNNLYRHSELNMDKGLKGFFEDNGRVRCQPFLKVKSEGFFTTLDSLYWTGVDIQSLKKGDQFDELKGKAICEKYISPSTRKAMDNLNKGKKKKVLATPMFNKHVNTDQFRHFSGNIPVGALLSFHHKVHGTSARYSYSKVVREPLSLWDKVKDKVGLFSCETWEYMAGTRNVVLHEEQYDKEGFHGSEQFRFDILEMLKPYLEKGMTVYGEIAGFANGSPIMGTHATSALKDKAFTKKYGKQITYKYGCTEDTLRFHVYRISITTEEGSELDFTDQQVMQWCENRDILPPLEVVPPYIHDGNYAALNLLVEALTETPENLTEDRIDPSHVSEGIVIRVDYRGMVPKFYKNKSYAFKVLEGIAHDTQVDYEASM